IPLYEAHNEICLYTWGQRECCLPRGATSATLAESCDPPAPPQQQPPAGRRPPIREVYPAQHQQPGQPNEPPPQRRLNLQAGDVLIFEEVIGPRTGDPADADPTRRQAVRRTKVTQSEDTLYDPPMPIVEVEWGLEDALPFTLCISAITDAAHGCKYVDNISVARGNVILVDHGGTIDKPEDLGVVPCAATEAA